MNRQSILRIIGYCSVFALTAISNPVCAQEIEFPKMVGSWYNEANFFQIDILPNRNVVAYTRGSLLGRVSETAKAGANFSFESESRSCSYNVTFINESKAGFRLVEPTSSKDCPGSSLYTKMSPEQKDPPSQPFPPKQPHASQGAKNKLTDLGEGNYVGQVTIDIKNRDLVGIGFLMCGVRKGEIILVCVFDESPLSEKVERGQSKEIAVFKNDYSYLEFELSPDNEGFTGTFRSVRFPGKEKSGTSSLRYSSAKKGLINIQLLTRDDTSISGTLVVEK